VEAKENMQVNADPQAAQYYFVLNREALSPYRDGRVAFFGAKGEAYTAVLNENLVKTDIKPAPELDGLGIEGSFAYDASRNKIYFSKGGELFSSAWKNGRWETPQPITFARIKSERQTLRGSSLAYSGWRYKPEDVKIEGQKFSTPALSSDGKTLYYAAELPGTLGGSDIWYSTLEKDGTWSVPVNLGENVNSELDENFPFLVGDTAIFFASASLPLQSKDTENLLRNEYRSNGEHLFFAPLHSDQKSSPIIALLTPEKQTEVKPKEETEPSGDGNQQTPILADVNDSIRKAEEATPEVKPESTPELAPALAELNEASSKIYIKDPETCVFLFEYDNDQMIGSYYEEIDILLKFLRHYEGSKFLIEGHTDERGSEEYNRILSEKRAKKLYQILIERGIAKEKLQYAGKGKAEPIIKGAQTEDEHQKNRRVEIRKVD